MTDVCGDFETGAGRVQRLRPPRPPASEFPAQDGAVPSREVPERRVLWRVRQEAGGPPISLLRHYIEQQDRPVWPAHVRPPSPPAWRPAHWRTF